MTQVEKMRTIIKCLKLARARIADGTNVMICIALYDLNEEGKITARERFLTIKYIDDTLTARNFTLADWAKRHHRGWYDKTFKPGNFAFEERAKWNKQWKTYRLAWIDHMVACLQKFIEEDTKAGI